MQAAQARLALAAGDLPAVERWAASGAFLAQQEHEALSVARLRIAQGQAEAALELLEHWRPDAHAQGRARSEVEILLLSALAHSIRTGVQSLAPPAGAGVNGPRTGVQLNAPTAAGSDPTPAMAFLARALALAQPQGYRRIFLDEGQPMAALLRAALPGLARRPLATYAAGLLRALALPRAGGAHGLRLAAGVAPAATTASSLLEPLSPQEQRVLRLLVAGLSNAAIARELVVSTNTIKTQLKSIYRKLDVANRDEAREAARELGLL